MILERMLPRHEARWLRAASQTRTAERCGGCWQITHEGEMAGNRCYWCRTGRSRRAEPLGPSAM